MSLFGLDLGGTKIEGAVVDPERPQIARHRVRIETEAEGGYEHLLSRIESLVRKLEGLSNLSRPAVIGVGTPGTTDPHTGILKNSNTLCLNGRTLQKDLSRTLGVTVRLANDANCFALAEAMFGAAKDRRVVVGLILGTGVGSGIVVEGKVLHGLHGIAGEWGHNPISGEQSCCYCGRKGCVETVISGPALERFYQHRAGRPAALSQIVLSALKEDTVAEATLERLVNKFGESIAAVINIVDPDAIVIGGGVGNIDLLYSDKTRAAIQRHLFNSELRTELLRPTLGDSAGVFGAALLGASSFSGPQTKRGQ